MNVNNALLVRYKSKEIWGFFSYVCKNLLMFRFSLRTNESTGAPGWRRFGEQSAEQPGYAMLYKQAGVFQSRPRGVCKCVYLSKQPICSYQ